MVIVLQRFLHCLLKLSWINNLFINLFGSERRHAVSPKQPSNLLKRVDLAISLAVDGLIQMFKGLIEVELPGAIDRILGDIEQVQPILLIDQPIRKHSKYLMHPDTAGLLLRLQSFLIRHADSEDDSSEVSQVEQIVRFCRGWKELLNGVLVDVKRGCEDLGLGFEDIGVEVESTEEPFENGGEDSVEGLVLERGEGS